MPLHRQPAVARAGPAVRLSDRLPGPTWFTRGHPIRRSPSPSVHPVDVDVGSNNNEWKRVKQVLGVQYLRGFAALGVVLFHVLPTLGETSGPPTLLQVLGSGGVDVFFVISGFIIWTSTQSSRLSPASWWASRLIRIVPLYWVVLLLALLVQAFNENFDVSRLPTADEMLKAFAFVFTTNSRTGEFTPYFVPGWTLNYEFFFYAMVGLTLFLPKPAMRLPVIVVLFLVLVAMRKVIDQSDAVQFRYSSPLMLEFIAGIFIALVTPVVRRWRGAWLIGIASLVAAVLALVFVSTRLYPTARFIYFGLPAALLVFGTVLLEDWIRKRPIGALRLLGDSSYSLYLIHTLVLRVPPASLLEHHLEGMPLVVTVLMLVLAIGSGVLMFKLVEQPLLRWMREGIQNPQRGRRRTLALVSGFGVVFIATFVLQATNGKPGTSDVSGAPAPRVTLARLAQ